MSKRIVSVDRYSNETVYFDLKYPNKTSFIGVSNTSIRIIDRLKSESHIPLKDKTSINAIQIDSNFQIELGRNYKEFEEALRETNIPIVFMKLITKNNIDLINIIRMGTGKIPTVTLATIKCISGKIVTVSPNRELIKNDSFKVYCKVPKYCMFGLAFDFKSAGYSSRIEQVAARVVPVLKTKFVSVIEKDNKVLVITSGVDCKYTYEFMLNKEIDAKYMRITSISLSQ